MNKKKIWIVIGGSAFALFLLAVVITVAVGTGRSLEKSLPLSDTEESAARHTGRRWYEKLPALYAGHLMPDIADYVKSCVREGWNNSWSGVWDNTWYDGWEDDWEDWYDWDDDWDDWYDDYDTWHGGWENSWNDWDGNWDEWYEKLSKTEKEQADKADKVYADDKAIAGDDINSKFFVTGGMSSAPGYLKAKKMSFNGSSTQIVNYVNASVNTELTYDISLASGKFKVVQIGPDNKVTTIVEGSGSGKKKITMPKGRNSFKIVGNKAALDSVELYFTPVDKTKLTAQYASEWEEKAYLLIEEFKSTGKMDMDKLISYMPFVDDRDLAKCVVELLKGGKTITKAQWGKLMPFLDEEILQDYYRTLMKGGKAIPYSQIQQAIPFLDSEFISEYILFDLTGGKKLTAKELSSLFPFADEEALGENLVKKLKAGVSIDMDSLTGFLTYMDEEDLADCILALMPSKMEDAVKLLKRYRSYLDEDGVAACLKAAAAGGYRITAGELKGYLRYMDEDDFLDVVDAFKSKKVISEDEAKNLYRYVRY